MNNHWSPHTKFLCVHAWVPQYDHPKSLSVTFRLTPHSSVKTNPSGVSSVIWNWKATWVSAQHSRAPLKIWSIIQFPAPCKTSWSLHAFFEVIPRQWSVMRGWQSTHWLHDTRWAHLTACPNRDLVFAQSEQTPTTVISINTWQFGLAYCNLVCHHQMCLPKLLQFPNHWSNLIPALQCLLHNMQGYVETNQNLCGWHTQDCLLVVSWCPMNSSIMVWVTWLLGHVISCILWVMGCINSPGHVLEGREGRGLDIYCIYKLCEHQN